ncbi:MAG: NADH dehydrogenase subunit D, partial [Acidimicrobiia bacterium]
MSEDLTTEDATAGDGTDTPATEGERRQLHEIWAAGTEEPAWVTASTAEGAQLMLSRDNASEAEVAEEGGTLITDDRLFNEVASDEETTILNMGPQHPSTHGVLRLQLELEGEIVRRVKPVIGYLHTGMEKTGETLTFMQGPTNVTRMDYLAPFHNELCFSLATEALLDIEIPPRAQAIRVLMTELNRVSSHLTWVAT